MLRRSPGRPTCARERTRPEDRAGFGDREDRRGRSVGRAMRSARSRWSGGAVVSGEAPLRLRPLRPGGTPIVRVVEDGMAGQDEPRAHPAGAAAAGVVAGRDPQRHVPFGEHAPMDVPDRRAESRLVGGGDDARREGLAFRRGSPDPRRGRPSPLGAVPCRPAVPDPARRIVPPAVTMVPAGRAARPLALRGRGVRPRGDRRCGLNRHGRPEQDSGASMPPPRPRDVVGVL